MMELFKGSSLSVQEEVNGYLSKIEGRLLCRSRRTETAYYPKYNNMAAHLNIHICFTGDTWHQIFGMANNESGIAMANIKNGEINLEATMREAAQTAVELFGEYGYKAVRAVLMDFGKHLADAIGEFEIKFDSAYNENGLELNVRHIELEILQDVDWIEELMEGSGMLPR